MDIFSFGIEKKKMAAGVEEEFTVLEEEGTTNEKESTRVTY